MFRTCATGILLSTLVTACGDGDGPCMLDICGTGCVDVNTDPNNCGACFNECGTAETCVIGTCEPTAACTAPEEACGDTCVDTQTSIAHCGECDVACPTSFDDCIAGACSTSLVAMRAALDSKGDIGRDVFVVQDITLALTRLGIDTIGGDRVIDHAVLPDGRVLLVAAQDMPNVFELYVSSPRGGALTKLSGTLVANGGVLPGLAVSADGTKVLYRADQDVDDQFDLYAVAIANPGATVKVNGALVANGEVSRVFALSADGTRATYIADQDTDDVDELYTVDLSQATPGASIKLNPALVTSEVWDFQMSSDGSRVLYRSDEEALFDPQLFVVDVATPGTANPVLNTTVGTDYHVNDDYQMSPDGSLVVYSGSNAFVAESLWVAPLSGATLDSTVVIDNIDGNQGSVRPTLAVTGGSVYVLKDVIKTGTRLFRVDVATPNVLAPVFDPNTNLEVDRVKVSPNGSHLAFGVAGDGAEGGFQVRKTDEDSSTFGRSFEIYVVDLATLPATPVRVGAILQSGHDGIEHDFFVLDDGRVIFRADLDTPGTSEVYLGQASAPDAPTKLSPDLSTVDSSDIRSIARF